MDDVIRRDVLLKIMVERKRPLPGADGSKDRYRYMQWLADYQAIKEAPTIEPCENAISIEVAIQTTWMILNGMGYPKDQNEELDQTIKAVFDTAPRVAPSRLGGEWIPCSERLPEDDGKEYLTYQCCDGLRYGWCQVLNYDGGWNCFKGDRENEIMAVVAWMPLPEPWKGADE